MDAGASEDGSYLVLPSGESSEEWISDQLWICFERQRDLGKIKEDKHWEKEKFILDAHKHVLSIISERDNNMPTKYDLFVAVVFPSRQIK